MTPRIALIAGLLAVLTACGRMNPMDPDYVWTDSGWVFTGDTADSGDETDTDADADADTDADSDADTDSDTDTDTDTDTDADADFTHVDSGETSADAQSLGTVSLPMTITGQMSSTGGSCSTAQAYGSDVDWFTFQPTSSGTRSITLSWAASDGDYDFAMWDDQSVDGDGDGNLDPRVLGTSAGTQPESTSYTFDSARVYLVAVQGWCGGTGSWTFAVQ